MGRLTTLFEGIKGQNSGWNVVAEGEREFLTSAFDQGIACCEIKIEALNEKTLKYSVAVKKGADVRFAQRPHAGVTGEDLARCLAVARTMGETMIAE
ncbi:MAG: hypothetical protein SFU56_18600 [Capsulimonadales bacterium]|nr:hypothetical protein [Capsulimonadales bacterium]